jgi:hypothetical protein
LVSKLKAIFQKIEELTQADGRIEEQSLIQFFYDLCEEQPGVVAVRHSFESFGAFVLDGRSDTAEPDCFALNSELLHQAALGELPPLHAETPSNPHGENDPTDSLDSSSGYDGDSTVGSGEQLETLEAVSDGQQVEQ